MVVQLVIGGVLLAGLWGSAAAQTPGASEHVTYEAFMRLELEVRQAQFQQLSPETRARLMRAHAERWLATNEHRLSVSQARLFTDAIATITRATYSGVPDPERRRREDELGRRLHCGANTEDVIETFGLLRPPRAPAERPATWQARADAWATAWLTWFFDCVVP